MYEWFTIVAIDKQQHSWVNKVIFEKQKELHFCYVVDLKQDSQITDTKKAGCGDRLFSCVRRLETRPNNPICWLQF